jgi:hypothetical protein
MRASEQIASDAIFLKLFGPGVLELLPRDGLFDQLQVFQSAPGGGKTSLMRLFTPTCLLTLHAYRANDDYKDLYQRLKGLEVLDESAPRLLGVMLSCAKNYAALEDMDLDDMRKDRLFFSFLDCRIVLAALRGALLLRRLDYPTDLKRLQVNLDHDLAEQLGISATATGQQVYQWARKIEGSICDTLDSLQPSPPLTMTGHDGLYALGLLRPEQIMIDGTRVTERVLIMLDDVHKLAHRQRERLIQALVGLRNTASVWIAERLEALGTSELLGVGATANRDYGQVINLESFWRQSPKRFETTGMNIADRRARAATDVEIESFAGCLQSTLDGAEWAGKIQEALDTVISRVKEIANKQSRFKEWVTTRESLAGTIREKLVAWRTTEILIERESRKQQLAFDFSLSAVDLEKKDDSAARAAAEIYLTQEFHLPYYFGFPKLVSIASSNIEQFLAVAGELFEEAASAALVRKPHDLSPDRQEKIIRRLAAQWWEEELPRRIPYSRETRALVDAIATYARWETYKPNAPYSPGVTGIAITMADRDKLRDASFLKSRPDATLLAAVLATCLAHNLLEAELNYSQGYERWMVLYLNRLLCVHFGLPLQYGGWRPKKIDELCRWQQSGFRPPKNGDRLL